MKASRLKVIAVEQKKQILEWKQEQYQNILTNLYSFQNKYFNSSSSPISDEISKSVASSSSAYITATTMSSDTGSIYIDDIVSIASAAKLTSSASVSANPKIEINTDNLSELGGKSIVINLNGIEKTLNFTDKIYNDANDVKTELESLIEASFGSGQIKIDLADNAMTLIADNSTIILKTPADGSEPSSLIFDSFESNRIEMNVSISSAGFSSPVDGEDIGFIINGKTFSFTSSDTLSSVISAINSSDAGIKITYSVLTDTFTMTSAETGSASKVEVSDTAGTLMSSLFGIGIKTKGTDAVVKLSANGSTDLPNIITVTRSTNSINVNGTAITLNGKAPGDTQEQITVTLTHDNDAITKKVKAFISDYNTLLSSITSKLTEEYDRSYLPLTDDEKKDMSESDIELWTKKAKTGLLQNDSYLKDIQTQLRSVFYTAVSQLGESSPTGSSPSLGVLSDIGISTTKYGDMGQLTFNETIFKNALNSNADKVIGLLTQKSGVSYSLYSTDEQQQKRFNESGALERLCDVLKTNLNKTGNKKGMLINLVGSPSDIFAGTTEYSDRLNDLKDKINDMNDDLYDEEERYWKQFTAMESALAKLSQQSAWITSMMSGNKN